MPLIVDAHADLAYNALKYGRDYSLSAAEIRKREVGSYAVADNENATVGWEDYQRGQVALIFATLYAMPARWSQNNPEGRQVYKTFDEANRLCRAQMDFYRRLSDSSPDKFRLVTNRRELEEALQRWNAPARGENGRPVGMIPLMEGADAIRGADELEEWHDLGLRLIGLAWVGTRYSGGWKEPGPLTAEGRKLLAAMADFNFILDVSHMDEKAALEALDSYRGPIVATHGNCLALLPDADSNRHFSDRVIEGVIERDGVVGVTVYNSYLKSGWKTGRDRREEVPLDVVAAHIDHICQIAGDSLHAGIGSDLDGGFGLESIPPEMDTVADLQKLAPLLQARGYSEQDVENIFGGNWIARLRRELP